MKHSNVRFCYEFLNDENSYSISLSANREDDYMEIEKLQIPEKTDWVTQFEPVSKLVYLSAVRCGPSETFPKLSTSDYYSTGGVGTDGKYASHWYYESSDFDVPNTHKCPNDKSDSFRNQVNSWLNFIATGTQVNVQQLTGVSMHTLEFRTSNHGDWMKPANVGHGLTYVFPIIVSLMLSKPGDLIIIDSPEAHLHPSAQSCVGKMIAQIATSGVQIIVETHSEHILNGIRLAVMNKILAPEQLNLLFFTQPTPKNHGVLSPSINKHGKIDIRPDGFFDQNNKDIRQLIGFD